MSKRGSYGDCELCGERKGKAAMVAHLKKCLQDPQVASHGPTSEVLLLRVQSSDGPMFWLDVAVKPDAKLRDLDRLLRNTWLECCGHLSEFYGNARRTVSMNTGIGNAFDSVGDRIGYVYDFGSSTELVIRLSGNCPASLGSAVTLVARNEPPTWPCHVCGQAATSVCTECEYEGQGFCCSEHLMSHDCGEEMLLPVVNSPRMGVCGYTGED